MVFEMELFMYITRPTHFIKICKNLIEKPQTFNTFTISIQFRVEVREVADVGKHYCDFITRLVI